MNLQRGSLTSYLVLSARSCAGGFIGLLIVLRVGWIRKFFSLFSGSAICHTRSMMELLKLITIGSSSIKIEGLGALL